MKTQKHINLILRSSLALALGLAICSPIKLQAAEHEGGKMMEECQAMMETKKQMMAEMKAKDSELTEQVAKMNRAPDDQKMAMMAEVINIMAQQRAAMNERKAKMEEAMMTHMMKHMKMGKESMGHCKMMMKDGKPANTTEAE